MQGDSFRPCGHRRMARIPQSLVREYRESGGGGEDRKRMPLVLTWSENQGERGNHWDKVVTRRPGQK